ncbi:MAG TPA: hypothetical protein VJ953_18495 [Saprospiraceae bacterium]|nr:hypothetical protein [Saprospiraceae bacterium]
MYLIVKEVRNSKNKRYDVELLKENGMFEEDEKFSMRLMFYQEKDLSKSEIKRLAQEMFSAKDKWKQGKQNYIYNFHNGGTGIIPIDSGSD